MSEAKQRKPLKMSALAKESGVPAATIKHYLREGLLPPAVRKTGRNMAYYDPAVVERIVRIKQLQRDHFLPLKVIKQILDGGGAASHEAAAKAIARTLARASAEKSVRRRELLESGVASADLELFERLGLITPRGEGAKAAYGADDLQLLRTLAAARAAGLSEEMLPARILGPYTKAIQRLVDVELRMFQAGVLSREQEGVERLTEQATILSEQLVLTIRRKLLLPTLGRMIASKKRNRKVRKKSKRVKLTL